MKLFENGVGRPSNEIKKKRKIFIASAIVLCVALISVFAFTLTKVDTDRLSADTYTNLQNNTTKKTTAPTYTNENTSLKASITSMWCDGKGQKCKDKDMNLYVSAKGTYAKYYATVTCTSYSDCTRDDAWDAAPSRNKTGRATLNTGNKTIYLKETNKTIKDRTFFVRLTTYVSDNASKWANVYICTVIPTSFTKEGTNRWLVNGSCSYYKTNTSVVKPQNSDSPVVKPQNSDSCKKDVNLVLNCPTSPKKINQAFQCTSNKNLAGVTISATSGQGFSGNNLSWTTTANDNAKDLKYSTAGTKKITATYTCNGKTKNAIAYVEIEANSSANKTPETKPKETKTEKKPMKISCSKAVANKEFTCTVKNSSNKKLSKAKISVNTKTDLAKNYKNSGKGSLKLKYTKAKTVKVTATLDGYKTKTVEVKIAKAPTTTAKKETSSLEKYNITAVINKVTKKNNNEKQLEINVKDLGKNVKYVRYKVCLDRAVCVNDTAANNTYLTDFTGVKKGQTNKVNITTLSSALLNQEFYVRIMTYDKNKKLLYWKVNHFYTNPKTDAKSKNKNVSDESKVKVGDYTGTTSDFLVSLKSDKVKSKYQANYRVPSVKKLSNLNIDKGIEKQYNVVMQDFGESVKFVSFALCNKLEYCTDSNTLEIITSDSSKGGVLLKQIPENGKEFIIKTTGDSEIINQKFHVRIYSYDANQVLLFSKIHEFTTDKKSKLGATSDSKMEIGDRVKADVTASKGSKKY